MTNVDARFLLFLLFQSATNARYTHIYTTISSLAPKRELELDVFDMFPTATTSLASKRCRVG